MCVLIGVGDCDAGDGSEDEGGGDHGAGFAASGEFFFLSSPISCSIPVRLSISVVRCRTSDRFTRSRVFCRGFWEVFRCGFDRSCGVLGFAVAGVRFGFDSSVGGHACRISPPPPTLRVLLGGINCCFADFNRFLVRILDVFGDRRGVLGFSLSLVVSVR